VKPDCGTTTIRLWRSNHTETAMANADRNNLKKSGADAARNQRRTAPQVGGATGNEEASSPEEARNEAVKTFGKTKKNDSGRGDTAGGRKAP